MQIIGLLFAAALYVLILPFILVIFLRVFIWVALVFGLDDACARFAASVARSYEDNRKT